MSAELMFVNEVIICQKMGSWRKWSEFIDKEKDSLSFPGQPIFHLFYCIYRLLLWRFLFAFYLCIRCYFKMVEPPRQHLLCPVSCVFEIDTKCCFRGATFWTHTCANTHAQTHTHAHTRTHTRTKLRHDTFLLSGLMTFDPVYYNYLFFSWSRELLMQF